MKKNIIITSGPTNERIDAVMKITNMSTGALGNVIAETFLEDKYDEIGTIYYVSTKMSYKPRIASEKVQFVTVESTQDLIDSLQRIFATTKIEFKKESPSSEKALTPAFLIKLLIFHKIESNLGCVAIFFEHFVFDKYSRANCIF